jgi:hypothetical protein
MSGSAPTPPTADPPSTPGFAPRSVAWREGVPMLRAALAMFAAAPVRFMGFYLLFTIPLVLIAGPGWLALPVHVTLLSIALTGIYAALESARRGEPPGLRDMCSPWLLPAGKIVLLGLSGALPLLAEWLVWWGDLGTGPLQALLGVPIGLSDADSQEAAVNAARALSAVNPPLPQKLEEAAMDGLLGIPLLLLSPLCVLRPWSANRTLAANLIASLKNWHWGLALAVILEPIDLGLQFLEPGRAGGLLLLLVDAARSILASAFVLALMHRAVDPSFALPAPAATRRG